MNRIAAVALLIATGASFVPQDEARRQLNFPQLGYSINALEANPGSEICQTLIMYLEASDGFAPNVNIQIQSYSGSLDDYLELSRTEFDKLGLKSVKQEKSDDAVLIEYQGEHLGNEFHWYAKITKKDDKIYLATATCKECQWEDHSAKLIECVKSFKLDR